MVSMMSYALLLIFYVILWHTQCSCSALCPDLEQWTALLSSQKDVTDKFDFGHMYQHGYADIFRCTRFKKMDMLEIGLGCDGFFVGEGPKAWRYIIPNTTLNYIEYDKNCTIKYPTAMRNVNGKFFFGDQSDLVFLDEVVRSLQGVDVLIDDGSHQSEHQIKTFKVYSSVHVDTSLLQCWGYCVIVSENMVSLFNRKLRFSCAIEYYHSHLLYLLVSFLYFFSSTCFLASSALVVSM